MEDYIKQETKALDNRIRLEDLEKAIETALDNPIDLEFAIDTERHVYRGQETKSIFVKNQDFKNPHTISIQNNLVYQCKL